MSELPKTSSVARRTELSDADRPELVVYIAEMEAENEWLTRLLRDWDALVSRAMEGSRVTGVSPLECLELLARATGLVDAQHRAEKAETKLAERDAGLVQAGITHNVMVSAVEFAGGKRAQAEAALAERERESTDLLDAIFQTIDAEDGEEIVAAAFPGGGPEWVLAWYQEHPNEEELRARAEK